MEMVAQFSKAQRNLKNTALKIITRPPSKSKLALNFSTSNHHFMTAQEIMDRERIIVVL
jgi:hypothetical protein